MVLKFAKFSLRYLEIKSFFPSICVLLYLHASAPLLEMSHKMTCHFSVISMKISAGELLQAVLQRKKIFSYVFHQKRIRCWLLVAPHSLILLTSKITLNLLNKVVLGKKEKKKTVLVSLLSYNISFSLFLFFSCFLFLFPLLSLSDTAICNAFPNPTSGIYFTLQCDFSYLKWV